MERPGTRNQDLKRLDRRHRGLSQDPQILERLLLDLERSVKLEDPVSVRNQSDTAVALDFSIHQPHPV